MNKKQKMWQTALKNKSFRQAFERLKKECSIKYSRKLKTYIPVYPLETNAAYQASQEFYKNFHARKPSMDDPDWDWVLLPGENIAWRLVTIAAGMRDDDIKCWVDSYEPNKNRRLFKLKGFISKTDVEIDDAGMMPQNHDIEL